MAKIYPPKETTNGAFELHHKQQDNRTDVENFGKMAKRVVYESHCKATLGRLFLLLFVCCYYKRKKLPFIQGYIISLQTPAFVGVKFSKDAIK